MNGQPTEQKAGWGVSRIVPSLSRLLDALRQAGADVKEAPAPAAEPQPATANAPALTLRNDERVDRLQRDLNMHFRNPLLLREALTHKGPVMIEVPVGPMPNFQRGLRERLAEALVPERR